MQKSFTIYLQDAKLRLYQRLSWFIIAILTLIYVYLGFFSADGKLKTKGLVFLIVMAVAFLLKQYFQKTKYSIGPVIFFILLVSAFAANEQYLFAGATFFFQMLHAISIRPKIVQATAQTIVYPSFPSNKINWLQLNNAMLKDGLLTIDFKNDKIIQQPVDDEKTKVNEAEFNEFCQQQLKQ